MSLAITLWATGLAVSFGASPSNYDLALFVLRVGDTAAIFIPLLYLHFIVVFLGRTDQQKVLKTFYGLSIPLALFAFSPLYIPGLKTKMGIMNFNDAGPLFLAFFALYLWEPFHAFRLMLQARAASTVIRKAHITYVMAAGIVGFLMGAAWFPLCFDIPISPLFGCFVWFYCFFVAWAVFKYQLFDIRVVIRKSLAYSILITLLTVGYFGIVYGVEKIFQTAFGYHSVWISLMAFAVMALVFQPLKVGIQRLVDWLIFRKRHEELVKHVERLEQEALQAEKFKAISTLATGMAHEIKNPLTAIKTHGEFLPERHGDPVFVKRFSELLAQETSRINGIVQDLLDFAKPKPPQLKQVDIGHLITSTVDLLSGELSKHQIRWTINCRHDGATIQADSDQLRQVLINLIQNAADAMPNGGSLTLATQANNGHLELTVSDTGQGIPKEILPRIFDPFVTTKPNGNGLGLAVVYSIVQSHRGTIHAASSPGLGATFTVRLPP